MQKVSGSDAQALFKALLAELPARPTGAAAKDSDLCRALEIRPSTISKLRAGAYAIPDSVRVAVLRNFKGWTIRRLDEIAPPQRKAGDEAQ